MIIVGICICLLLAVIAFFLFAIWRAIIGKSSVDVKLADVLLKNTKALESNSTINKALSNATERLNHNQEQLRTVFEGLPSEVADKIRKELQQHKQQQG